MELKGIKLPTEGEISIVLNVMDVENLLEGDK